MNILLIDNNTKHIEDIKNLCPDDVFTIRKWSEVTHADHNSFDLLILSGGSGMAINKHEEDFIPEIELIRNTTKPCIGICLGFELICHTFGSTMEREDEREKGLVTITTTENHPLFHGQNSFTVYMAHKWHTKEVSKDLVVLARSEKGIDIVKHATKNIYGFQFHPEILEPENDGATLFKNCIQLVCGD